MRFISSFVDRVFLRRGDGTTVDDPATDTKLDEIKQAIDATGALTDEELRAVPVQAKLSPHADIFSNLVIGQRDNQVQANFFETISTQVTQTVAGGGSITQDGGQAVIATGTSETASANAVTPDVTKYRAAHELYSFFTAAFTTPTHAGSFQRIGLYNDTNGFFIGYEGTSFGLTVRRAGVDATIARASWDGDALDGSAGSRFTRGGVPEAIDLTKVNVYAIRFGWLGSAHVVFEVMSPDGEFVTFHTTRQPNSAITATITDPELPMRANVSKTSADATSLVIRTACWAAGSTSEHDRLDHEVTDASLFRRVRAVLTGKVRGGPNDGDYVNVRVNPQGRLEAEVTGATVGVGVGVTAFTQGMEDPSGNLAIPRVNASNQQEVEVRSSVLPTDAATETTQSQVLGRLNISVSALRDALRGAQSKDLTTLEAAVAAVEAAIQALPAPQTDALTNNQMRASPVPVDIQGMTIEQMTVNFPDSVLDTANGMDEVVPANEERLGTWIAVDQFNGGSVVDVRAEQEGKAYVQYSRDSIAVHDESEPGDHPGGDVSFRFGLSAAPYKYARRRYVQGPVGGAVEIDVLHLHSAPPGTRAPVSTVTTDRWGGSLSLSHGRVRAHVGGGQFRWIPHHGTADGRAFVNDQHVQSLTDDQLRATPIATHADVLPRVPAEPKTMTATRSGAATSDLIPAPGPGKRLVIHYVTFTPEADPALVTLRFKTSGTHIFQAYAAGKGWIWTGDEDEAVEVTLDKANKVAFTLLYEIQDVV